MPSYTWSGPWAQRERKHYGHPTPTGQGFGGTRGVPWGRGTSPMGAQRWPCTMSLGQPNTGSQNPRGCRELPFLEVPKPPALWTVLCGVRFAHPLRALRTEKKIKKSLKAAVCDKTFSSQSSLGTGAMPQAGWPPPSPTSDTITVPWLTKEWAPTICPTQMLAASIMAPSAMDRTDSFSRWGFPDSSSSTTYEAAGRSGGRGSGDDRAGGTVPYISVLLQRDLPIVVRVVHVEEDWEGGEEGGRVGGAPVPPPPRRPPASGKPHI